MDKSKPLFRFATTCQINAFCYSRAFCKRIQTTESRSKRLVMPRGFHHTISRRTNIYSTSHTCATLQLAQHFLHVIICKNESSNHYTCYDVNKRRIKNLSQYVNHQKQAFIACNKVRCLDRQRTRYIANQMSKSDISFTWCSRTFIVLEQERACLPSSVET